MSIPEATPTVTPPAHVSTHVKRLVDLEQDVEALYRSHRDLASVSGANNLSLNHLSGQLAKEIIGMKAELVSQRQMLTLLLTDRGIPVPE